MWCVMSNPFSVSFGKTHVLDDLAETVARCCRPTPHPLPSGYIDPEHRGEDLALLETFYQACNAEGGTADEIHLRGIRAVLAARPTPQPPADGEVGELAAELRHFVAEYQQMRGLDPENIYSIQQGDPEKEAHLRISRLTRIADLLERLSSPRYVLDAATGAITLLEGQPVPVGDRLPELRGVFERIVFTSSHVSHIRLADRLIDAVLAWLPAGGEEPSAPPPEEIARDPQPLGATPQWPDGWSRRQRAEEAERLCSAAGLNHSETRILVNDAKNGMPLQVLTTLISDYYGPWPTSESTDG